MWHLGIQVALAVLGEWLDLESWRDFPTQTSPWCNDPEGNPEHRTTAALLGGADIPGSLFSPAAGSSTQTDMGVCCTSFCTAAALLCQPPPSITLPCWGQTLATPPSPGAQPCRGQKSALGLPWHRSCPQPRNTAGATTSTVLTLGCSEVVLAVSLPASKLENTVQTGLLLHPGLSTPPATK